MQNDLAAQYNLGNFFSEGKYVVQDMKEAINYFIQSANLNHPQAQYIIGLYYIIAFYKKPDEIKRINSFKWLLRSSNYNCTIVHQPHFSLGFLYQRGKYKNMQFSEKYKFFYLK